MELEDMFYNGYGIFLLYADNMTMSGVPQESVLGLILFVCFINDMPEVVESFIFLYADDSKILRKMTGRLTSHMKQRLYKETLTHCRTGKASGSSVLM